MNIDRVESIAKSLGLTLAPEELCFLKSTGGKIKVQLVGSGVSVYGTLFSPVNASDTQEDVLYWALQWAAHCR